MASNEIIEIRYKCSCLSAEVSLNVPARRGPAHDVKAWMDDVVAVRISADHRKRSPTCPSTTMEFVKIPVPPGSDYVGQVKP